MSYDVFISYKSEDKVKALWVKENLEANGISCWMAPESIPGGSNYAMEIAGAMAQCRCVVVAFTSITQTSMWVDKEIELALNMKKTVLPFMMEQVSLQGSFQLYLSNVQQYAAYQRPKEALTELIRDIRKLQGAPVAAPKIVSKPPFGSQGMGASGVIAFIIGLLLLAAIGWLMLSEGGLLLSGTAPSNGAETTTTASPTLTDGTTTTASTGTEDTTAAPSADATTTTTTTAQSPVTTPVIGEARLDAVLDVANLAGGQTNLSRQTAAALPMDGMVGGLLKEDAAYWYSFTTTADVSVYRVAGLRANSEASLYDLYVTLYNAAGMIQQEINILRHAAYDFEDFVLEPNTQYYVKVSSSNLGTNVAEGYGLFVSPRAGDAGLSKEDATELVLGQQYTFTLNSILDDWFVFKSDASVLTRYQITVYNVDVGGKIEMMGTDANGGNVCSLSAANGDSASSGFYASNKKTVYFQIGPAYTCKDPNGTYVIVLTAFE